MRDHFPPEEEPRAQLSPVRQPLQFFCLWVWVGGLLIFSFSTNTGHLHPKNTNHHQLPYAAWLAARAPAAFLFEQDIAISTACGGKKGSRDAGNLLSLVPSSTLLENPWRIWNPFLYCWGQVVCTPHKKVPICKGTLGCVRCHTELLWASALTANLWGRRD